MDLFTRFNRKNIQDRQIDTLIGLSKGLTADNKIDQNEAEFLQSWLIQNITIDNPIILNLLNRINEILEDGILDADESSELLITLKKLSGEKAEIGEVGISSTLPLCSPPPKILFPESSFLFTGTCAFGARKRCQQVIEEKGGINAKSVTRKLDYLVIGTYVTDSWAHETFGRKIEKAIEYRNSGLPLAIISEEHWINEAEL